MRTVVSQGMDEGRELPNRSDRCLLKKPSTALLLLGSMLLLLLPSTFAADSYEIVTDQSEFTSEYRVLIGVPGDDDLPANDNGRAKARRGKIEKVVEGHVERMAEKSVIEGFTVEYAYMSSDDAAFLHFFPKHTEGGKGDLEEPLGLPAVRLMNAASGDFMLPDWDILLMELPDELDRLVGDFERWMAQTDDVAFQSDGVMLLHSKNIDKAIAETPLIFTAFYAPWCKYSQAMLPKVGGASQMLVELVEKNLLPAAAMGVATVNVDEEGSLRKAYNVTTYPTLVMLGGDGNERNLALGRSSGGGGSSSSSSSSSSSGSGSGGGGKRLERFDGSGLPFARFSGDAESSADIVSHLATLAHGAPTLVGSSDVEAMAGLVRAVDGFFATEGGDGGASTAEDGGRKRCAAAVLLFHGKGRARAPVDPAMVRGVRDFLAVKETFVAATSDPKLALDTLVELSFDGAAEAVENAAAAAAAAKTAFPATLLVATRANGVVPVPLPSLVGDDAPISLGMGGGGGDDDDSLLSLEARGEVLKALWPSVSRFSTSAVQGERIRSGLMSQLAILVADEDDAFMFEGFFGAFKEVAKALRGEAFFLYADDDEPRIAGLLRNAGVAPGAGPVVVVMQMGGGGGLAPTVLPADRITVEDITAAVKQPASAAAAGGGEL